MAKGFNKSLKKTAPGQNAKQGPSQYSKVGKVVRKSIRTPKIKR